MATKDSFMCLVKYMKKSKEENSLSPNESYTFNQVTVTPPTGRVASSKHVEAEVAIALPGDLNLDSTQGQDIPS